MFLYYHLVKVSVKSPGQARIASKHLRSLLSPPANICGTNCNTHIYLPLIVIKYTWCISSVNKTIAYYFECQLFHCVNTFLESLVIILCTLRVNGGEIKHIHLGVRFYEKY